MAYTAYKIPDRGQADGLLLEWLKDGVEQSAAFLARQRPADDLEQAYQIISGRDMERTPEGLSDVRANRLKRQTREIVGTLSDINCLWNYNTDAKEWDTQKSVLNKMAKAWYENTRAKQGIRKAIQYAAVMGTGWILPNYKRDFWTVGRGDITLGACGPMGVLPIQLPEDGDIQRAYAGTIRHEVPIAMAHAKYPLLQNLIVPDRDTPSMMSMIDKKIDKFLSPVLNIFGSGQSKDQNIGKWPTVDIFHTYVMDLSINETGQTITMGEPGTSWEYQVPSLGSSIPAGKDSAGNQVYRKATAEDAMLYPLRRLIVWSRTCKISDGTSPWWHGKFPAVKLVCDDWPWEVLGFSIIRDGVKLERARNQMMRDIQDTSRARMNPPVQYSGVAKSDMEKLNLRKPGTKLGVDMGMGGEVKPILPAEHYVVPAEAPALIQFYGDEMDYTLGVKDMTAFAKAKAMPAGDFQQIEEFAGPLVKDISNTMEGSVVELGQMIKPMFFQFYNVARRVQLLGEDGITPQDFDYEPGMMVPSHMPGEDKDQASRFNKFQRARQHCNNFFFQVTPGTLHEITQMSQKLLYLQLQRAGFPMDPWTLAEVMQIPNFGPAPKGTNTVMERWVAWQRMRIEEQAEAQKQLAAAMQGAQVQGAANAMGAAASAAPQRPVGRPPTAQQPPHIVQKDGGSRSTISES